jgi:chromosomal replication initiator protein
MNPNKIYTDPEIIKGIVCDYFKVPVSQINSTTRKREIIKAKHIAIFCFRKLTDFSLTQIAREFNLKEHATVINAINSVNGQSFIYPQYRHQVESIIGELQRQIDRDFMRYQNYNTDLC